ncbi:hypothetical protein DFH28DRAFT_926221 [Melampsora americana]|nr:hypothetical protein DFH28DRAFT_926221 [Melampsora americana]
MTDIIPLSLPLPSFLIDPQDGEFTPYDARSLVDPSESSNQSDHQPLPLISPSPSEAKSNSRSSPPKMISTTNRRSRATSDVLERLLTIQANQLNAMGQAWREKFSFTNSLRSNHHHSETSNLITDSVQLEKISYERIDSNWSLKKEKEKSGMDETGCSVRSISGHTSILEDFTNLQEDLECKVEEEQLRLEVGKEITPLTETVQPL